MKSAIFVAVALSFVLANAAYIEPVGLNTRTLEDYAESLSAKADQVSKEVEIKYDEIVAQPIERVEASVIAIEERKQESEECVDQQKDDIEVVVQSLESSLNACTQTASTSSAAVALEIVELSIDVAYDTLSLVKGVKRCRRYTNSILKKTCYATQLVKAEKLVVKTTRAASAINQSVDETLPEILGELEGCSADAERSALEQLETINRSIDSCVAVRL